MFYSHTDKGAHQKLNSIEQSFEDPLLLINKSHQSGMQRCDEAAKKLSKCFNSLTASNSHSYDNSTLFESAERRNQKLENFTFEDSIFEESSRAS